MNINVATWGRLLKRKGENPQPPSPPESHKSDSEPAEDKAETPGEIPDPQIGGLGGQRPLGLGAPMLPVETPPAPAPRKMQPPQTPPPLPPRMNSLEDEVGYFGCGIRYKFRFKVMDHVVNARFFFFDAHTVCNFFVYF